MSRTFVIAEAAGCHDGSLDKAYALVDLAADIGVDACKFQWVSSPEQLCERRRAPEYLEAYRVLNFSREWFPLLEARCQRRRIEFMCTVYLPEDIAIIAPYVKRFKVASFEAGDLSFVRKHVQDRKPIIISAGMNGRTGHVHGDAEVYWLHCVSAYPTPVDQMNLGVLRSGNFDGLSDHSLFPWMGALAVAAGASIIEFHLRLLDTDLENPDYGVSRTPEQAVAYIANIRMTETILGDGIRRVMPCETSMLPYRVQSQERSDEVLLWRPPVIDDRALLAEYMKQGGITFF